ncbi:MAG: rhodanese-like domain-containing protein [Hyphomonadaceae bacterium]|nr:rhodanese-like domain-containing protein [Hyphomonadaceae bacterium]
MRARKNGVRNSLICGLLAIATFIGIGLAANAQETPGSAEIDFAGFMDLSDEVFQLREDRLLSLEDFNQMAAAPNTIILDARSQYAYEMGHIEGAVNLPFSDFTDEKLAEVIPNKDTRVLIYCNNNFTDDVEPIPLKRVALALNIPTFINLYGYGYENIYELGVLTETTNADVNWVSSELSL